MFHVLEELQHVLVHGLQLAEVAVAELGVKEEAELRAVRVHLEHAPDVVEHVRVTRRRPQTQALVSPILFLRLQSKGKTKAWRLCTWAM